MFLLLFSIAIDGFFSSFRVHCWRKEAKLKTQFFRSPNGATRMRWFIRKCAVLMIATTIFWSSSSSLNEVCCRLPDGVDRQTARALCQSIDFCFLAFSFPPFFSFSPRILPIVISPSRSTTRFKEAKTMIIKILFIKH